MATSFGNPIFSALGGFFSASDNFRHAIVGTTEGKVFEIFFNPQQGKGQAYLACFDHIVAADAFYTPDDNFAHVVVVTPNGDLSEIFYNQTGTFFSVPPLANFTGVTAVSGFYTADDTFRHVIVATADGNLTEVYYGPQIGSHVSQPPLANFAGIVAISAFYTPDDTFRHVIVATNDGNLTEVFYGPQIGVHISQPPLANFSGIVDIAGFYTDDDQYRHVIVATSDGNVTEVFYHPSIGVHISQPPLANFSGIVGIAGFYTSDDGYRHVIVATADGGVSEVFYSPKTGSFVSRPPLGVFGVDAPALEDISPDVSNLDDNATAVLDANRISTAGRSVAIAGRASELFVFNEKSGVWISTDGLNWSQLPNSPLAANLFPPSSIAVDPNAAGHLVAGTEQGAFESSDDGATWSLLTPTWPCWSNAIRAVAFASNSALILATECGIATRPTPGAPFAFFATSQPVGALAMSETKLWACTVDSLFVSTNDGTTWTPLLTGDGTLATLDTSSLAATDDFVYVSSSIAGLGGCGAGNIVGIFNVALGSWTTQSVQASGVQTCSGTGLGGRLFVKSFLLQDPNFPPGIGPGARVQLFFGAAEEVYQALGIDSAGNVTNWSLVVATNASGAKTSGGTPPAVHIHPDIWDFLIDTSVGGNKAWVAGDGGVYETTLVGPFIFPESGEGWIRRFGGMHTHQAHMITVIPTNPVNRSRLAYPTADNEGWYRNAKMLVTPAPGWEVTFQNGNLGDASWSVADASSPRFILIARHEELAAFVNYNASPDIKFVSFLNFWKKKDQNGNVQVLGGHFYPGPTSFYFVQSPAVDGRFPNLDAIMMCDLPLIRYNPATDTNDIMLPGTPLGQNTNGQPVLLRNRNFDANPDINVSNAAGWAIELASFPPDTLGCYVTGSRGIPIYYSFTSNTLSRWDGASWIPIANNLVSSQTFGPAFVNPYDVSVLYIITPAGIQVSNNGSSTFNVDSQLTSLVAGSQNLPMTTLAQIAFHYNNPAEMVAGATSGVFYRNAAGRWADLTYLLPRPLSLITGVGIDCEALYVSFDSRSIVRITGYRNA